jgi:hypothetical protein
VVVLNTRGPVNSSWYRFRMGLALTIDPFSSHLIAAGTVLHAADADKSAPSTVPFSTGPSDLGRGLVRASADWL